MISKEEIQKEIGFEYWINTQCRHWDPLRYHKSWVAAGLPLAKGRICAALKKQLSWFQLHGSEREKISATKTLQKHEADIKKGGRIYKYWGSGVLADVAVQTSLEKYEMVLTNEVTEQMTTVAKSATSNIKKRLLPRKENVSKRTRISYEYDLESVQQHEDESDDENDDDNGIRDKEEQDNAEKEDIEEFNDDEFEVDPTIEPFDDEDIPGKSTIGSESNQTFPQEDSDPCSWILPSGISVANAIKGTQPLPNAHPSNFGVIRIGHRIKRPDWILRRDWRAIGCGKQSDIVFIYLCKPIGNLISSVDTLYIYLRKPTKNTWPLSKKTGNLKMNAKNMIIFFRLSHSVAKQFSSQLVPSKLLVRKNLLSVVSWCIPSCNAWLTPGDSCITREGEIFLHASANRRLARHGYTPDLDKPLGMKVDGIFQIPGNDELEVGFVEISGGPLTNDRPRYLKDHVRGVLGLRDLVDESAVKLASGDFNTLRRVKMWFVHVYGLSLEIWSMDLPVKGVYRMALLGTFKLPIHFDDRDQLLQCLPILWQLGEGLGESLRMLVMLKRSHSRSSVLQLTNPSLTKSLGDIVDTPSRPTGKSSRIIYPIEERLQSTDSEDE
ncbi:hypothetical protein BC938DRAFT_481258 [Jimgerdemannia flammicorona]|uniref:Uncharacterized protein n=1 Tax=Jimgerdemannia flammicorona TaxID=994334 RepID=A0A433QX02_9FUNG|nr:hypothetical protein BC938DRAFT_481258 [Jimgerdemannia flammicorona]